MKHSGLRWAAGLVLLSLWIVIATSALSSSVAQDNQDAQPDNSDTEQAEPEQKKELKTKKKAEHIQLELEPTPDILAEVKARFPRLFCVGFAAETEALDEYAQDKLQRKGVEMIAANWVGPAATETEGTFGSDTNALRLFWKEGSAELPVATKEKLARQLILQIAQLEEVWHQHTIDDDKVINLPDSGRRPTR